MSTLIERLTELGFTLVDEEEGEWTKQVGRVTVRVTTHEYEWDGTADDPGRMVEREHPEFQTHMWHSCDEWVIDNDTDPSAVIQRTLKFSTDVAEAAALLAQVVAS